MSVLRGFVVTNIRWGWSEATGGILSSREVKLYRPSNSCGRSTSRMRFNDRRDVSEICYNSYDDYHILSPTIQKDSPTNIVRSKHMLVGEHTNYEVATLRKPDPSSSRRGSGWFEVMAPRRSRVFCECFRYMIISLSVGQMERFSDFIST